MQVHVVHDKQGNIRSLAVPGPQFRDKVGIRPKQDEQVSVVDRPDLDGEQLFQDLRDLSEHYRVDLNSGQLVQK